MGLMVWWFIVIYNTNNKKNVRIVAIIDYYIILLCWILHYVDCFTIYSSTFIPNVLYAYFNFRILVVSFHGVCSALRCYALDDYRRIKYHYNNVGYDWSVRDSAHDTKIINIKCYLWQHKKIIYCFLYIISYTWYIGLYLRFFEEVHYTLIFLSCIIYFHQVFIK